MKRLFLPLIALVAGSGLSQGPIRLADHSGLTVQAVSFLLTTNKFKKHYVLKTNVQIISLKQGLSLFANQTTADTIADPHRKNAETLTNATAIGNVKMTKTVTNPTGKQTTEITGTKADYLIGTTESTVKMAGPVRILNQDPGKKQTMEATGSSGIAYLEPTDKSLTGNGLHKAVLQGPAKVVINQGKTEQKVAGTYTATADQAIVEMLGETQRITLIGNVHIVGSNIGDTSGVQHAVMLMDKSGNVNLSLQARS